MGCCGRCGAFIRDDRSCDCFPSSVASECSDEDAQQAGQMQQANAEEVTNNVATPVSRRSGDGLTVERCDSIEVAARQIIAKAKRLRRADAQAVNEINDLAGHILIRVQKARRDAAKVVQRSN